jgi:hypothetical protein
LRYRMRSAMSVAEFQEALGEMLDELPACLLEELSGGIIAEPGAKQSEEDPGLLTLGQYHQDPYLGRFIVLYYGSFAYLYAGDRERWLVEMRKTLRHEIRHHLEQRAGVRDLEREDQADLRRFLEE